MIFDDYTSIECSFNSFSSSISVPDNPTSDQLGLIKDKNKKLQKAATLRLQDFKNASRNLVIGCTLSTL